MPVPGPPSHLFLFNTGNPTETPVFTSAGHFTFDNTATGSQGTITLRALDNSWIAKVKLESFGFNFAELEFLGVLSFTANKGVPPFPATLSFGPIAMNVNVSVISDPDITNNPNLIAFVAVTSPPVI